MDKNENVSNVFRAEIEISASYLNDDKVVEIVFEGVTYKFMEKEDGKLLLTEVFDRGISFRPGTPENIWPDAPENIWELAINILASRRSWWEDFP